MEVSSLTQVAEDLLAQAKQGHSGRAAQTVYGGRGHVLRQTVIALAAEHDLAEHESPDEATLQVLLGRVRLTAGNDTWEGNAGDLLVIPPARHALAALVDSAVLLTVRVGQ
jgi:quercetin dioxygenase-like cupin family protein